MAQLIICSTLGKEAGAMPDMGSQSRVVYGILCCYFFIYKSVVLCNIGYPSETYLKPKSHKISFAHNILISNLIVLKFCTEHGSDIVLLCAIFQSNWTTATDVKDEQFFADLSFGWISYIAQHHSIEIRAWITKYIHIKNNRMWLLIHTLTSMVLQLHSILEVREWMSDYIPYKTTHVITHPCLNLAYDLLVKDPWYYIFHNVMIYITDGQLQNTFISMAHAH